mgnify:CR=1 FL=1
MLWLPANIGHKTVLWPVHVALVTSHQTYQHTPNTNINTPFARLAAAPVTVLPLSSLRMLIMIQDQG